MKNLIPHFIYEMYKNSIFRGSFKAITMFVDISGFTPMTEKLMKEGNEGAEILSIMLNSIFDPLIYSVYKRGGFISGFAGDAFTAIFRNLNDPFSAIFSAMEIRDIVLTDGFKKTKFGDFNITVKIGLSYGAVEWGMLGMEQQKTYFFRGNAIDNCAKSEKKCSKMDIILDSNAFKFLYNKEPTKNYYKILKLNRIEQERPEIEIKTLKKPIIQKFISEPILAYSQIGEFRDVVSIFISFVEPKTFEQLNEFVTNVITKVNTFGGYFNRLDFGDKGSNILIFFGTPTSYEDNIERAVNFVLSLKKEFKNTIRIGMTFGIAYSGFVGSRQRAEYTCLGDVTNLSARFMMKAEFGNIWITEEIVYKIKDFYEIKELGYKEFKGKTISVKVFELIDKQRQITGRLFEGQMIGRFKELEILKSYCNAILSGKFGSVVYVYGEPGVGKSRLVYEVSQRLKDNVNTFTLQVDSILKNSMNPFVYFLNDYFKQMEVLTDEDKRKNFEEIYNSLIETLQQLPNKNEEHQVQKEELIKELIRTKSILGALIGIRWESSLYEQLDAKGRYDNTQFALKDFFKAQSLIKPIIIIVEDLQWLDADSDRTLNVIARNMEDYPIIIIATSRLTDAGIKPEISLDADIIRNNIAIKRLANEDVEELSTSLIEGPPDERLLSYIMLRSEGNPFYIEQFCQFLKENKIIRKEDGKYRLLKANVEIPKGIRAILIARVDRLSNELKEAVRLASILGREFDILILEELINKICYSKEFGNTALRNKDINRLLFDGERERIWNALSTIKYIFRHKLLQNAVYQMQLKSRKRELHRLAANSIEEIYKNDQNYFSDIAFHYERASILDKTEFYLEQAADFAKESYLNEQAIKLYNSLLKYIRNKEKEIMIKSKKSSIFQIIGKWEEAEELLRTNIVESSDLNNKKLIADNKSELGSLLQRKGMYAQAISMLEQAYEMYKELDDKRGIAEAIGNIGTVYHRQGKFDEAKKCYSEELQIAKELDNKVGICNSIGNIGILYKDMSNYSEAMDCYQEQLYYAESIGDKISISRVYANVGVLYYLEGKKEKALEYYQKQITIASELGNKLHISNTSGNIGLIYYDQGNYEKAIEYYEIQRNLSKELGNKTGEGIASYNLGLVYYDKGEYEKSLETTIKCLKTFEEIKHKQGIILNSEHLGRLYKRMGDYTKSEESFDRAIETSKEINIKYFLCSNLYEKALLYYHLGKTEFAYSLNKEAMSIAEEVKRLEIIFKSKLMNLKIIGKTDSEEAIKGFNEMLNSYSNEKEIAEINYELFKITKKKEYRLKSLELYKNLYEKEPDFHYKEKINEMEKWVV